MRKRQRRMLLFIIMLICISAILYLRPPQGLTGLTAKSPPSVSIPSVSPIDRNNSTIAVYFCPYQNCSTHLVDLIMSANRSVHCAFYELELRDIILALKEKSSSADVKIVVDNDYYDEVKDLSFVRQDSSSQYSHNKFCIIDGEVISGGSMNPTFRCTMKNNNNLIIIRSKYLAVNYEEEFKELWEGYFGEGGKVPYPVVDVNGMMVENYFCPEDSCGSHIQDTIAQANKSVYFMTFSFTHAGIANELILAKQRGLDIKGIFEKSQNSQYNKKPLLEYQGIATKWDNNSANMHNKVFIIDNEIVITGSFNPSANADERNDENILIIHDKAVAEQYLQEFNLLWEKW